jgi:uncharacterized protein (DUF1800 family)
LTHCLNIFAKDGKLSKKFANHVLDRLTYGARPADISAFNSLGANDDARLLGFVNQQLDWSSIDDTAFDNLVTSAGYESVNLTLTEMWAKHHAYSSEEGFDRNRPREEMERLCIARAMHSKRQLVEVLADFWHNHFNVYSGSYYAQSVFTSWDRDVIRPPVTGFPRSSGLGAGHMLGNFRQMLELSSKHVAMQYFLDNYINQVGGPNENYAREVMELHTLGAQNYVPLGEPGSIESFDIPMPWGPGGADEIVSISKQYVDDDIYSAMRMLTGWKIKDSSSSASSDEADSGEFFFYEPWHDKYVKIILGHQWSDNALAPADVLQFFDVLAYHPGTAQHIAGKLCRRFISPNPDQAIIDAVADTFYQQRYAPDQLEQTYRTMLLSAEFKDQANWGKVFKRPMDAMVSALRICDSDFFPPAVNYDPRTNTIIYYFMNRCGQKPFNWTSPDGYPMKQEHWQSSNGLIYLLRFIDWICDERAYDEDAVIHIMDMTVNANASALPAYTPNALSTFWLKRILGYTPSGGWPGNHLHTQIQTFLQTNPNDLATWGPDIVIDITTNSYNTYFFERLRGAVKLILSSSEFLYR